MSVTPEMITALQNPTNDQIPDSSPPPPPNSSPQIDPAAYYSYQQQLAQAAYTEGMAQQNAQLQNAIIEMQINSLPEEQRAAARETVNYYAYLSQQESDKQQMAAYLQNLETAVMPLVKDKVISKFAEAQKIDREILDLADSPQDLVRIMKVLEKTKAKQQLANRINLGTDNVGGTGSGAAGGMTKEQIKKQFAGTGKLENYYQALRAAGY